MLYAQHTVFHHLINLSYQRYFTREWEDVSNHLVMNIEECINLALLEVHGMVLR